MSTQPLRTITRLATLAALAAGSASLGAQASAFQERWRWSEFTVESGLPSNVVSQIVEARDGTPWVVTERGLAWFDGYLWRAIGPRVEPSVSMSAVHARALGGVFAVLNGHLYIADTGGVRALDVSADGQTHEVLSAAPLAGDTLLVVTRGTEGEAGLWRWQPGELTRLTPPARLRFGTAFVWSVSDALVLLRTGEGFHRWQGRTWSAARCCAAPAMVRAYGASGQRAMYFLLSATTTGLYEMSAAGEERLIAGEGINAAVAIGLGPADEALVVYETGHVRHRLGGRWFDVDPVPPGLQDVTHLARRANGDWWVATRHGVYLYRASSTRWVNNARPFPDPLNRVNAIARDHDGSIWAGTGAGVIVRTPSGAERVLRSAAGVPLDGVTGVNVDDAGNVWLGSGGGFEGALRWDGRVWRHFGAAEGLPTRIHRIERDREGELWFLGLGGAVGAATGGAYRWRDGGFSRWPMSPADSGRRIFAFADGPDGTLWFGTDAGLVRYRAGQRRAWAIDPQMRRARVFSLATDSTGTLWIADQHSGIGLIDRSDTLRVLTSEAGLVDNRVWEIRRGPDGTMWVATARGLSSYRDGVWQRFGTEEGLVALQVWPILPETSTILVGTLGAGLQILNTAERDSPAIVRIREPARVRDGLNVSWSAHSAWGQQLEPRILTRHRVNGGAWSPWSTVREARLSERTGAHVLAVQALGLFGQVGPVESLRFDVAPPLVMQPVFFVPVALLMLALGFVAWYAARRRRDAQLEMRALEEQLRQSQKMESLGQLAGGVAHDFNNLLTAIMGHADLLEDSLPVSSQAREDVTQIRNAATRGATMIRKLLMFGHKGQIELRPESLDAVVSGLSVMLGRLLPESITLIIAHRQQVSARVDLTAVEQSLVNLATNARDAMPGGGELRISVARRDLDAITAARCGLDEPGRYACLEVIDTGTGMDAATRARAFDPFFTTKQPDRGTGLGLAMVYSLTRRQGGGVELESTPGRGTTVRLYLPLAEAPAPPTEVPMRAPLTAHSTRTILVVEDEALVRETTTRVLRRAGYEVRTAANGAEGLAVLRESGASVDLVLTDVVMPKLSGYRLYADAAAAGISVPFIFTSGHTERGDVGAQPEGLPFIAKPWGASELLSLVRAELERAAVSPRRDTPA